MKKLVILVTSFLMSSALIAGTRPEVGPRYSPLGNAATLTITGTSGGGATLTADTVLYSFDSTAQGWQPGGPNIDTVYSTSTGQAISPYVGNYLWVHVKHATNSPYEYRAAEVSVQNLDLSRNLLVGAVQTWGGIGNGAYALKVKVWGPAESDTVSALGNIGAGSWTFFSLNVSNWQYANDITRIWIGIAYDGPSNGVPSLWDGEEAFDQIGLEGLIVPGVPSLLSPPNNSVGEPTSLALKWNAAAKAMGYECQVSTDPTFGTNSVVDDSVSADTTDSVTVLATGTKYYWHVRAYNTGTFSAFSAVDTFTTVVQAPEQPTLVSPADNATGQPAIDTLVCSRASGAAEYQWEVSENLSFSSFVVNDSTTDTVNVVSLKGGTKYYWKVRAVSPGGASPFAGPDSFTVMSAPAAPALVSPANNASGQRADSLMLKWNTVSGAAGYECQVSLTTSFSSSLVADDSIAGDTLLLTDLKNVQKYYWRVGAYNAGGIVFSKADSFTTIIAAPAEPQLYSPSNGAQGVSREPTFEWYPSVGSSSYDLQISTDYTFATVALDTSVTDTAVVLSAPLAANAQYYWRVSASNAGGASGYSVVAHFTTGTGITSVNESGGVPKQFELLQNYPNPFNPTTVIKYSLPKAQMVTLIVYNSLGQKVATLVNGRQNAGYYNVTFNGAGLASGVYFYVLRTESFRSVNKMLLLK